MFLGVHVCAAEETATIDPTNVATTARAAAIYGAQIAAVNAWVCFRSGVKHAISFITRPSQTTNRQPHGLHKPPSRKKSTAYTVTTANIIL